MKYAAYCSILSILCFENVFGFGTPLIEQQKYRFDMRTFLPTAVRSYSSQLQESTSSNYESLFEEISESIDSEELQTWMIRDMGRRRAELLFLGWLGRAYCFAPILFRTFFKSVFLLEPYTDEEDVLFRRFINARSEMDKNITMIECVVKESSVVPRGAPIRLRLEINEDISNDISGSNKKESSMITFHRRRWLLLVVI